jgi:aspartate-semialdehyde dehydrogenase
VVPHISGEEDKIETEVLKILGTVNPTTQAFEFVQGLDISATCNRVMVLDGHTECVSLAFASGVKPSVEEITRALDEYT